MGINRGGYTVISNSLLPTLTGADIRCSFKRRSYVLLWISKLNGTQPYTIITQYRPSRGFRVYLSKHTGTAAPVNRHMMGPYIYLDTLPYSRNRAGQVEGFEVNGKPVTFRNWDNNDWKYFGFHNPFEMSPSIFIHIIWIMNVKELQLLGENMQRILLQARPAAHLFLLYWDALRGMWSLHFQWSMVTCKITSPWHSNWVEIVVKLSFVVTYSIFAERIIVTINFFLKLFCFHLIIKVLARA